MRTTDLPGAVWRKSSFCTGNDEGVCVEVATFDNGAAAVRDSKDPLGTALLFESTDWTAFTAAVKAGHFA